MWPVLCSAGVLIKQMSTPIARPGCAEALLAYMQPIAQPLRCRVHLHGLGRSFGAIAVHLGHPRSSGLRIQAFAASPPQIYSPTSPMGSLRQHQMMQAALLCSRQVLPLCQTLAAVQAPSLVRNAGRRSGRAPSTGQRSDAAVGGQMSELPHYADLPLERAAHFRGDPEKLAQLLRRDDARLLPFNGREGLAHPSGAPGCGSTESSANPDAQTTWQRVRAASAPPSDSAPHRVPASESQVSLLKETRLNLSECWILSFDKRLFQTIISGILTSDTCLHHIARANCSLMVNGPAAAAVCSGCCCRRITIERSAEELLLKCD